MRVTAAPNFRYPDAAAAVTDVVVVAPVSGQAVTRVTVRLWEAPNWVVPVEQTWRAIG